MANKMTRRSSLCRGKRVKNPNRCKKLPGCKVATGKKRSFCRKKKNHTKRKSMNRSKKNTNKNRGSRLARELKKLKFY